MTPTRALLDVNVLIALLDEAHVFHATARDWLVREIESGWASCAITQNGFVRIVSQPRYPGNVSVSQAVELLRGATGTAYHEFWDCSVSMMDGGAISASRLVGHRQITDVYLLALAVARGGRFVTFDDSVPIDAVAGASTEHLHVLSA